MPLVGLGAYVHLGGGAKCVRGDDHRHAGAVLTIQLADPGGLLTPATGPIDFKCQIHIVTSRGIHYAAPIQSSAVGGRSHAITIPYGTPVALQVLAPHLVLNDSSGNPVPAAGAPISAAAGTVPATINYVVAGTK
jgi:hypothetical protein